MKKYTNPEFTLDRVSYVNNVCLSAQEETGSMPSGNPENEKDSGNLV